jgi:hypothetical protein
MSWVVGLIGWFGFTWFFFVVFLHWIFFSVSLFNIGASKIWVSLFYLIHFLWYYICLMIKSCIWQVNSGHFICFFYFIIQHLLWIKLWFFFILFFYRIITFHLISALLSNIRMISFYITSKYSFFKLIIVFF